MADYGYNYVDLFFFWKNQLVSVQNKPDDPYNMACLPNITTDKVNYDKYKKICLYFTKSMDYIVEANGFRDKSKSLNEICAYLNYYLNNELRNINVSNKNPEEFYLKMKANNNSNSLNFTRCEAMIKNIEDYILDDMKFIDNLFFNVHEYLYKITKDNTDKCPFAEKCYTSYNERLSEYDKSSSEIFCQKMKEFKDRYELYMTKTTCKVPELLPSFCEKTMDKIQSGYVGDGTASVDSSNTLSYKIGIPTITTSGIVLTLGLLYKVIKLVRKKYDSFTNS